MRGEFRNDTEYYYQIFTKDTRGNYSPVGVLAGPTTPASSIYTIAASIVDGNGTISPSGAVAVNAGASQVYTITPDSGYIVSSLLVDGVALATSTSHTFVNVVTDHTITASFSLQAVADTEPPVITLIGSDPVDIIAGDAYTEQGATALDGVDGVRAVTVSGTVNTQAVGTYVITYSATDRSGNTESVTRTVNVTLAPTYTISATAGVGGTITPLGTTTASSTTNQTYNISTTTADYVIATLVVDGISIAPVSTYTFTNIIKNHTIEATFSVLDTEPPVITLIGSDPVDIIAGDAYSEQGATALDEVGGSTPVIISGTVNTNAGGTYIVTYTSTDQSGNTAVLTRTVEVTRPIIELAGSNVKSTSALITWTTADFADSMVTYGTRPPAEEGSYNLQKGSTEKVLGHRVYLSNLNPLTKYYYKATSVTLSGEVTVQESDFTTTDGPIISNTAQETLKDTTDPENPVPTATDTAIAITWTTDIPANSFVFYSVDQNMITPISVGGTELVTDHTVILSNLLPETTYYYLVQSASATTSISEDANDGEYYSFTTAADATAPIVTNIVTPIITSDSVAITWVTNEPADGRIRYGTESDNYTDTSNRNTTLVVTHLATISGLTPETTYYYVIESADAEGNQTTTSEQTFETPSIKEKIVFRGGGGGSTGVLQSIYDALLKENEANKAKLLLQDATLPVISNVSVATTTPFGATIVFETSKETVSFVDYGRDTEYGSTVANRLWSKNHSINIGGLIIGTDYNFIVNVLDKSNNTAVSDNQTFKTKFLTEQLDAMKDIKNIEQFQEEIESTIESILPSLVPPFVDTPVVLDITENSATINFKTNIKTFAVVSYIDEPNYDTTKDNPYTNEISDTTTKNLTHELSLLGLKPNTKYRIVAKAFSLPQVVGTSQEVVFTTQATKIRGNIVEKTNDSFTIVWTTDSPATSIIDYLNTTTGKLSRQIDSTRKTLHSMKIDNLTPGTAYEVSISGINLAGNLVEGVEAITAQTGTDTILPTITNFRVDSALVLGRTDRIQTIISWKTDEPATSVVYYEEGSGAPDKALANKQEDSELTLNHVVMLTTLRPGTVYRIQVASKDNAGNETKLPIRTIITPKRTESIVDVIFKNFDDTFNFIQNIR